MLKRISKWLFKSLVKLCLSLFIVAFLAEGILQLYYLVAADSIAVDRISFYQKLQIRLYTHWMNTEQKDPFLPPLLVFSNRESENINRLTEIFDRTRLTPSQSWKTYDFLQDNTRKNETEYTIHSNSHGFRGKEHPLKKATNTYRIIAMGSYQTFGLGVNDDQTYPSLLETELNQHVSNKKTNYEVWNAGRNAGTAIVGLAQIEHHIQKYQPDLLILDYGFVDPNVWGDNVLPATLRLPDSPLYLGLRKALAPLVPVFGNSYLWFRLSQYYYKTDSHDTSRKDNFYKAMSKMLSIAKKNHVKVILLQQLISYPYELYANLANEHGISPPVSVFQIFKNNPPSPNTIQKFLSRPSWINEFSNPKTWESGAEFVFYPYRLDFFQLNPEGQNLVAQALARIILK